MCVGSKFLLERGDMQTVGKQKWVWPRSSQCQQLWVWLTVVWTFRCRRLQSLVTAARWVKRGLKYRIYRLKMFFNQRFYLLGIFIMTVSCNTLNFLCWNGTGIMFSSSYLSNILNKKAFDICCISEHWLYEKDLNF